MNQSTLLQGAIKQGAISFLISGTLAYLSGRNGGLQRITDDCISAGGSATIVGQAVTSGVIMAIILTLILHKGQKSVLGDRLWPTLIRQILKNAIYAFGLLVIVGVVWQRIFGSIQLGPLPAALLTGLIAGTVSGITNYSTLSAMQLYGNNLEKPSTAIAG